MNDNLESVLIILSIAIFIVSLATFLAWNSHKTSLDECFKDKDHIIETFKDGKQQCCYEKVVNAYSGYTIQTTCYKLDFWWLYGSDK